MGECNPKQIVRANGGSFIQQAAMVAMKAIQESDWRPPPTIDDRRSVRE
jgi:hypothetical protein